jgi:hypothetical protein
VTEHPAAVSEHAALLMTSVWDWGWVESRHKKVLDTVGHAEEKM